MITVYGIPKSRSSRVTWCLEELELEYELKTVDISKGEHQSAEFLKVNPQGKIPVLIDGDFVVSESAAIVNYLCSIYDSTLIPHDFQQRAIYDQWSYFAMTELEQPLWTMGKHRFALPEEYRTESVLETANWEFQKALSSLSEGLGNKKFILGEYFSAADILIAHTLIWALLFKREIPYENINSYLNRCMQREAFQNLKEKEGIHI
ncbi:glutathione S-transferase family protein [Vibrio sp.]|nr:glutathione S-transferase family protein [Vibrio sp.]